MLQCANDRVVDGRAEWDSHVKILEIMKNDPIFDKSQRSMTFHSLWPLAKLTRLFMTRSDRYKRGLAMTDRIYELSKLHGWTTKQNAEAISLLDEGVPMNLHSLGEYDILHTISRSIYSY